MSEAKNDGGPAFPNITPDMNVNGGPGMSLRDFFAAKALAALITEPPWHEGAQALVNLLGDGTQTELFASAAYRLADAMLKERTK